MIGLYDQNMSYKYPRPHSGLSALRSEGTDSKGFKKSGVTFALDIGAKQFDQVNGTGVFFPDFRPLF